MLHTEAAVGVLALLFFVVVASLSSRRRAQAA
jgi:hypothetical protein